MRCILINHQMTRLTWDWRDPRKSSVMVWYLTIHFEKNYRRFLDSTKQQAILIFTLAYYTLLEVLRYSPSYKHRFLKYYYRPQLLIVRTLFRSSLLSTRKKKLKINVCSRRQTCLRRAWPLLLLVLLFRVMVTYLAVSQTLMAERLWRKAPLPPYQPSAVASSNKVWKFFPSARAVINYFEVTWHITMKLFPAKNLWAGNIANPMTSESNNTLLPANVDRRISMFSLASLGKYWDSLETKITVSLRTSHEVFNIGG